MESGLPEADSNLRIELRASSVIFFNYCLTSLFSPSDGLDHITLMDSFFFMFILALRKIGLKKVV